MLTLKVPQVSDLKPRIVVIGVGGAGGNAINNMIGSGITGVDYIVANTDAQALVSSSAERRIQLGATLTEGLGAGAKPERGEAAAEEAMTEIKGQLEGAHMVFIAAGMGGGTGTGAAPVIARLARELGILTVAIVTKPFEFEGQNRMRIAEAGIAALRDHVDTMIVIPNHNLFRLASQRTSFREAFRMADDVLISGVSCITELIVKEGLINLDLADVRTVLAGMGTAMMGTGRGEGEHRAAQAAEMAIMNPLLDDIDLSTARGLIISIVGGDDLSLHDVDIAANRIRKAVAPDATIIVGTAINSETPKGELRVSIVASGMSPALTNRAAAKPQAQTMVTEPFHPTAVREPEHQRWQEPQPAQPPTFNHVGPNGALQWQNYPSDQHVAPVASATIHQAAPPTNHQPIAPVVPAHAVAPEPQPAAHAPMQQPASMTYGARYPDDGGPLFVEHHLAQPAPQQPIAPAHRAPEPAAHQPIQAPQPRTWLSPEGVEIEEWPQKAPDGYGPPQENVAASPNESLYGVRPAAFAPQQTVPIRQPQRRPAEPQDFSPHAQAIYNHRQAPAGRDQSQQPSRPVALDGSSSSGAKLHSPGPVDVVQASEGDAHADQNRNGGLLWRITAGGFRRK
ncbi:MAG: Cell division protein FtsZ 1 [Pseudomonadota bacterium]